MEENGIYEWSHIANSHRSDPTQRYTTSSQILDMTPQQESLNSQLTTIIDDIKKLKLALTNQKHAQRMLLIDFQWLQKKKSQQFPDSEQADALQAAYKQEAQVHQQLKRDKAHITLQYAHVQLQAIKIKNPKLFPLKKKLLDLQQQHQDLFQYYQSIEQYRNQLSSDYTRLTINLRQEEKIKEEIIGLEKRIKQKDVDLIRVRDIHQDLRKELDMFTQESRSRKEIENLIQIYRKFEQSIQEQKAINRKHQNRMKELEKQLCEIRKGHIVDSSTNPTEQIRKQLRKLQNQITIRVKQINTKSRFRAQLQKELEIARQVVGDSAPPTKSIMKPLKICINTSKAVTIKSPSRDSKPAKFGQDPSSPTRSAISTSTRRKKQGPKISQEQEKRRKLVKDLEKTKGKSSEVVSILRSVGTSSQGAGSKIMQLNKTPKQY